MTVDHKRLRVGEPCYMCGKIISAPLSHMCKATAAPPTPHGELIEFLEGVAFQDLWNGRARDKFRAIVEVLKAAPSEAPDIGWKAGLEAAAELLEGERTHHPHRDNQRQDSLLTLMAQKIRALKEKK